MMFAAFRLKKKIHPQSLGIAGTVLLLFSPAILFSPGFNCSFAATAGIVILYPRLAIFKNESGPRFYWHFSTIFTLHSVSRYAVLFYSNRLYFHFGNKFSIFGLISNIIAD
jgi:predicted membrane metal-binding protein